MVLWALAEKLNESNFTKIRKNLIEYVGARSKHTVRLDNKTCSCSYFLKHAICQHALGYSLIKKLNWFKEEEMLEKYVNFVKKSRKGRPRLAGKALVHDD